MSLSIMALGMFFFGVITLYGGLAYFLYIALKHKKDNEKDLNESKR
jgi:hypothetical protein